MASNFQIFFIALSIVAVFVTGIPLAKYFSDQYVELRRELNSVSFSSKYRMQENLDPLSAKVVSHDANQNEIHTEEAKSETFLQNASHEVVASPLKPPARAKRRNKRRVPSQFEREHLSWNFELSAVRYPSPDSEKAKENDSITMHRNKNLETVIRAKGNNRLQMSIGELYNALQSVGAYIGDFFANSEKGTRVDLEFKQHPYMHFENKASPTKPQKLEAQNQGSMESSTVKNAKQPPAGQRGGRFLGFPSWFGGRQDQNTTQLPEAIPLAEDNTNSPRNGEASENLNPLQNEIATENFPETLKSDSDSLRVETSIPTVLDGLNETQQFNSHGTEDDCSDCFTNFDLSDTTNEIQSLSNPIAESMHTTESPFTDELLEKFCMSLVNKVAESQLLIDEGSDSEIIAPKENKLRSSKIPTLMDLVSFRSRKEKSTPDSAIIEDSLLVSNVSPSTTESGRQSRFFDFNNLFGLGSGRSAISEDEFKNSLSGENRKSIIDIHNLPSISDCENYFMKKQNIKMFPKPNLMDMMSDPQIHLVDFANETISTKLKEQNVQFLTDLIKTSLNNSVETTDKPQDALEKPEIDQESISSAKEINFGIDVNIEDKQEFGQTESIFNLSTLKDESTNSENELNEVRRDGRFIPLFGFGSGGGNNENSRSDSRWFPNVFGSGERQLQTTDSAIKSELIDEFGGEEAFQVNTVLFSSDSPIVDSKLEHGTTAVGEERFLGLLFGLGGSGDGRELSVELVSTESTSLSENDCTDDCSLEIVKPFEQSHDCSDCNFDHGVNSTQTTGYIEESECDDCYPLNVTYDNSDNKFPENALNRENFENLTKEHHHGNLNDCECFKKSDKNDNLLECDECNFDVLEFPRGIDEITENSQFQEVPGKEKQTELSQAHGDECSNCDHGSDLHITKETNSDKVVLSECDDCNSNVIGDLDSYENENMKSQFAETMFKSTQAAHDKSSESHTTIDREIFRSGCDDCNLNIEKVPEDSYGSESHEYASESTNLIKPNQDFQNGCDDCNLNIEKVPEDSYGSDESHEYASESTNIIKSNQDFQNGCDDCDIGSDLHMLNETRIPETFNEFDTGTTVINSEHVNELATFSNIDAERNSFGQIPNGTENVRNQQTTEMAHKRFLRPIFLTGSGDGNLFGNNNDTINLVEEESKRKLPDIFFRRRGRLHDVEEPCDDCFDITLNESEFGQIEPVHEFSKSPKLIEAATSSEKEVTVSSEMFSTLQSSTDVPSSAEIQPRTCTSARECNSTLNERCITTGSTSVCSCERAFVRHKVTKSCVVKKVVETSLKFPAEKFDEDLHNISSPRYKQMKKNVVDTVWTVFRDKPELLSIIAEVELEGFSEGSLIVNLTLILALKAESEQKLLDVVEKKLKETLNDENQMQNVALNIRNASVLSFVSEINPCLSIDLNFCSENAYCIWNEALPGRFSCSCRDHYRDVSTNPLYRGETCIAKCPPEYCGLNGHCEILANDERHCLCSGFYFGRRCEVQGLFVLIVLAVAAFISITIAMLVAFRKRCTSRSYGNSTEFQQSRETGVHMRGQVSSEIAMEENVGVTKYANISTPKQDLPLIKVTRPSIQESISFECDSTFDNSPSSSAMQDIASSV